MTGRFVATPRGWVWGTLASSGVALLVLTTTARLTLLSARFDTAAIGRTNGYERVYSQILPSPSVQAALRSGLAGLPIDPTYLTANVRVLLPPPVLEQLVTDLVSQYVDVLQLQQLRDWLRAHPDDVVTLILQDDVSPADVQATLSAAGLDPLLATPPANGQPWSTLGRMIEQGKTLVGFTQDADLTSGPIRNFYRLAAETPYEAATVAALTFAQGRGPVSARLFLVKNWLTTAAPSRSAALRVNNSEFLLARVERGQTQRGMRANFVAVDLA